MPEVQIGKYRRPGIFIEEFDRSILETPEVTGNRSLVIGSSKKGPVNSPVILNSQNDLRDIFGDLDRRLESKGSYFHRTISKVLESTPVIAMNVLNVNDDLDTLEYKSLSTSTRFKNNIEKESPYSRFFDTSSFWKKDRESFLNVTSEDALDRNRIMHFTNFSDREITVFVVKAENTEIFDTTLLQWYGSSENVPTYLDPKDFASDYLVDVVVVNGNWTDYNNLAVDPIWSEYFNTSGLIKGELFNFSNNDNVTNLYTWRNLSLIPFFRDDNEQNIFIETKINEETNVTGLYCAFDIDAVETDYRNGLLDLIGNNLINNNSVEEIDFLSYKDKIIEQQNYQETILDRPGNTNMITFDGFYQTNNERKALFAEGHVFGLTGPSDNSLDGSYPNPLGYSPFTVEYKASSTTLGDETIEPFAVIGSEKLELETTSFSYSPSDFTMASTAIGSTQEFTEVFFIDNDGTIKENPTNNDLVTNIVLGYVEIEVGIDNNSQKYFEKVDYYPISVNEEGFIHFDENDITTSVNQNQNAITFEFLSTTGSPNVRDYQTYRRWKVYNQMVAHFSKMNSDWGTILIDEASTSWGGPFKKSLEELTVELGDNFGENKTLTISGFDTGQLNSSILQQHGLVLHQIDDELIFGTSGVVETPDFVGPYGVIGEYSSLYQDYINGLINTGDYFYENLIDNNPDFAEDTPSVIELLDVEGDDYLVSDVEINFQTNQKIIIPESTLNTSKITISNSSPVTNGLSGVSFGNYFAYLVSENLEPEIIENPTKIWADNQDSYLTFYRENGKLEVEFRDSTLNGPSGTFNDQIDVFSQNSNFRQTIDIEVPSNYVEQPNKILIDSSRYTEVKIGDFLEKEVDESELEIGEVPKRLTRILRKRRFSGDQSLVEITCDSEIKKYNFEGSKQTYRFTEIEDYITEYKGISLFGFRVRNDSLPDNTDEKIQEILDVVGKGTPLFNAVTDKDVVDFRYLIDSYGLGLTENSKQQLADICGKRLDCFGILNMPSMKQFKNSSSPSFVDEEGRLNTKFIAEGGDQESSPAFNYSFAKGDGVSSVAYFAPYVTINDRGRPKDCPPAAYVAKTFLRKHNDAIPSVTPWTIAAGITNGQVREIASLEFDFTSEDIENLNSMKANPIVSKRNRGRVIETENTAQINRRSALSFIHVREVLIELERDLSDMLLNFQWSYNTPETRAEIKQRADVICEDYVNRNGLFNFFNKIDAENNTQTIIDNQYGVLDTFVEPIKGMGVIVNNVTILRTGAIDAGGFLD